MYDRAGQIAQPQDLVNVDELLEAYYASKPNPENNNEKVSFGTSGHRGTSLKNSFNEAHILSITQAIIDYRRENNINGTLFIGRDTHPLSEVALLTALQVLLANDVKVILDKNSPFTPTPVISYAILKANSDSENTELSDGIVVTPSHNPPQDGGFKYNPPHAGPAQSSITTFIANRANELLKNGWENIAKIPADMILENPNLQYENICEEYIDDLENIIDFKSILDANIKIGVHPLGGASVDYWQKIQKKYGINLKVIDKTIDPTWSFMPLDWDEQIRMDCSSKYAMRTLAKTVLDDNYDIGIGNDADADRHGIVTKKGLLNPNHYLAIVAQYLINNRPQWKKNMNIGKTLVSSSLIDKVCNAHNRQVYEVPVGFKYFTDGLLKSQICFCGEESAGATFLRKDGKIWTTDKDGIVLGLLAAEIVAKTGKTLDQIHEEQIEKYGKTYYERIDAKISKEGKSKLASITKSDITLETLGGEEIKHTYFNAPGDNQPIGGVKIETDNAWITIRPSGTEDVYKIYAESFISIEHLKRIQDEAKILVDKIITSKAIS